MTTSRGKRWTWTSFEEAPPEWEEEWMSYLVYGLEVCPDTQREHFQGYLETKDRITFGALKAKPGWETLHLEKSVATSDSNIQYACKEGTWVEWGTPMQAGKRNDLAAIAAGILSGQLAVADVLEENAHAYHVYGRTMDKLEDQFKTRRTRGDWAPPVVTWMHGPTGKGKSRQAWDQARQTARASSDGLESPYQVTTSDKGWWDLYDGQSVVILDDFRGTIPYSELLKYLDGHPVSVPRRGRAPHPLLATHVFVTSSKHPREVYKGEEIQESIDQLLRRITNLIRFDDDGQQFVSHPHLNY